MLWRVGRVHRRLLQCTASFLAEHPPQDLALSFTARSLRHSAPFQWPATAVARPSRVRVDQSAAKEEGSRPLSQKGKKKGGVGKSPQASKGDERKEPRLPPPELLAMLDTLFSRRTTTEEALERLRTIDGSDILLKQLVHPDSARHLAELLAATPLPRRAHRLLLLAHRMGCRLKQSTFECVAHQLAKERRWRLIPSLVFLGQRLLGGTTRRLLNWRTRAVIEVSHFALLEDTLNVFEKAGIRPDRRTFHLLVSGHIRNRDIGRAKAALHTMEQAGYEISVDTHALIVTAYRSLGPDNVVITRAFDILLDVGGRTATMVLNSLVQVCIDAHDPNGALQALSHFDYLQSSKALESMKRHALASFNQGVETHISSQSTHNPPMQPDAATFTILINYMAKHRDLPAALDVFRRMAMICGTPDASPVAALIRAHYAKGDPDGALHIVRSICRVLARDTLLQKLAADWESLRAMPLKSIPIAPTSEVMNALLEGVLRSRGLSGVDPVFKLMGACHLQPDDRTLSIIASHLGQVEHAPTPDIIRLLRSLYSRQIRPIPEHLHSILQSDLQRMKGLTRGSGWNNLSALVSRKRRAADLSRARLDKPPDSASFDPTAAVKVSRVNNLRGLIRPVLQSLSMRHVKNDRATYALRLYRDAALKNDMDSAKAVFHHMLARGMHPNEYHFASLMHGYANIGAMSAARAMMEDARRRGVPPNVVMFTIIIVGYARSGKPAFALRTFRDMVKQGIKPDIAAVDAVVSAYFAVGAYGEARRLLLELWPSVKPFPEELKDASLRELAMAFRSPANGLANPTAKARREKAARPKSALPDLTRRELMELRRNVRRVIHTWRSVVRRPNTSGVQV
ncbi:hypothetical protein JAAARDRAFT_169734 [Jaapia argillacea MUCL 33604]|uniref:Pentacotripeptide-repeat region of PRORP domain-containing protein n=1 Tax=Jaapia argillacea MUCL 33604 TaxID=933084 RepID=A0A067Q9C8_9AGAM|nr:hypothetical protein JAAARDRAFT_169734 [Jaapia argillacea MUCL 33604]